MKTYAKKTEANLWKAQGIDRVAENRFKLEPLSIIEWVLGEVYTKADGLKNYMVLGIH